MKQDTPTQKKAETKKQSRPSAKQSKPKDHKSRDIKTNFTQRKIVKQISINSGQRIAITGGIASGKSTILQCAQMLGFEVFSADKAAHSLLSRDGAAFSQVSKLFPQAVTDEGVDRKQMSLEIIQNPEKLKTLESILHPMIQKYQLDLIVKTKAGSGKSIIFEVPLLFENKLMKNYDYIIVALASKEIQKQRAMLRSGMSEEKLALILKNQVSDSVRIKGADCVINTTKSKESTINQFKSIVKECNVKKNSPRHGDDRSTRKKRR